MHNLVGIQNTADELQLCKLNTKQWNIRKIVPVWTGAYTIQIQQKPRKVQKLHTIGRGFSDCQVWEECCHSNCSTSHPCIHTQIRHSLEKPLVLWEHVQTTMTSWCEVWPIILRYGFLNIYTTATNKKRVHHHPSSAMIVSLLLMGQVMTMVVEIVKLTES
jgi:hypothetical protein